MANYSLVETPTLETGSSGLETAFNLLFCPTFLYNNFAHLSLEQLKVLTGDVGLCPRYCPKYISSQLWFVGAAGWDDHRVNLDS